MAFNRIKTRAPDGANMYKHEIWTKKINRDFIKGDGGEGLHFMKWFHKKSLISWTMASLGRRPEQLEISIGAHSIQIITK